MLNPGRTNGLERWASGLTIFAGLAGACGVAEAAAAAHGAVGRDLPIASNFLLVHAAVIAAASLSARSSRLLLASASVLSLALVLFCGDLTTRALAGARLFPMAAPAGGTLLIVGWLGLAAAGTALLLRNQRPSTR